MSTESGFWWSSCARRPSASHIDNDLLEHFGEHTQASAALGEHTQASAAQREFSLSCGSRNMGPGDRQGWNSGSHYRHCVFEDCCRNTLDGLFPRRGPQEWFRARGGRNQGRIQVWSLQGLRGLLCCVRHVWLGELCGQDQGVCRARGRAPTSEPLGPRRSGNDPRRCTQQGGLPECRCP